MRQKEAHVYEQFLRLSLISGVVPVVVYAAAAALLIALFIRRPKRGWMLRYAGAAVVGLALGFVIAWLIGDVGDAFDVTLTFVTRLWFALGVAGVAVAGASLWRTRLWRACVAAVCIPVVALAAGIGINIDIGEFPNVADALGSAHTLPLVLPAGQHALDQTGPIRWREGHGPALLRHHGRIGTVTIPATLSHFRPRTAVVYLPPAALVANGPALPVLELMGGQPGSPSDLITSGQLPGILDAYARLHQGIAPIVVIPDQLGNRGNNPMCVDSALGNSATYLTEDVPNWILTHLRVRTSPEYWGIGGYSQGGTCSIQLGAKHPLIYGNIIDISGQVEPENGTLSQTIARGFGGSTAAYTAALPLTLLQKGAPFTSTLGIFGVGAADARYAPRAATVAAAARAAKMTVHFMESPGTAHDWHTVQYVLTRALPILGARWDVAKPDVKTSAAR